MTGFRHVVLFTWIEGTTTAQVEEVAARLSDLPGVVPEIRAYSLGSDAGVNPGSADFAIVADFDDRDAYLAYRDNPEHRAVVDGMKPLIASRTAVQYEL
ncbi:Dabb family protein [Actinomadura harenae]|uniref:Dabb family protein n=1 Tax=Actinomadura harenae TaxID=2483351 RepID=A0A3M2M3W8_9ACTN|nr:Dabb family protein [Actinomadura harenae]RMI44261.1 Dabb family protein [Actinomadura harenae]